MSRLDRYLVTTEQMQQIEGRLFAAGMPVAALMEKVGGLLAQRFQQDYPLAHYPRVGCWWGRVTMAAMPWW